MPLPKCIKMQLGWGQVLLGDGIKIIPYSGAPYRDILMVKKNKKNKKDEMR